ncbi:MAG: hypothetical protein C5B60_05690 [Chloroflexi bacterium]|nr:MAG: hypothetical protein C5B60_05690 [Chloroflexota bacterium]
MLSVVKRESPVTLAREVLWRTKKRWRQKHLPGKLQQLSCPVKYRPVSYYQPQLEQMGKYEREVILRYADAICAGEFPWFAYGPVSLGFPPRWNLDFVSDSTWPELPSEAIQVVRYDGSDVKVPWELSRLQFLPVLGKAWRLSGEKRYRQAGRDLLSDWMEKNPTGVGVNWTIAMEAALRAISICLFVELLGPWTPEDDPWVIRVTKCLWQHLLFIEANNEFSHLSRGNHYLSNIVGLFCLATFLQGPRIVLRRRQYQQLIEQEILRQVYEDGGNYEASTGYHVLCLEMFTNTFRLMRCQQIVPAPTFTLRLRSMYRFLGAMTDAHGRVPQLGDCDDGRVELLCDDLEQMLKTAPADRHSLTVSGLLGIGECLFAESYGGRRREAPWYGQAPESREDSDAQVTRQCSLSLPNSGLAVARNGDLEVVFTALPNGIGGKGSHTHNDKLSLIVRIGEEELFTDPGTGCYTRNAELRNHFRATAAHNTIQVDGEEQNRILASPTELFRLCDDAHVSPIEVQEQNGTLRLRASHDGYCRLGITHSRTVRLTPQPSLKIEDVLTGSGSHSFQAFFHLQRLRQVDIVGARGEEVSCRINLGPRVVKMSCKAPVELQLACVPTRISTAYGLVHEATSIMVGGHFRTSVALVSHISWEG